MNVLVIFSFGKVFYVEAGLVFILRVFRRLELGFYGYKGEGGRYR